MNNPKANNLLLRIAMLCGIMLSLGGSILRREAVMSENNVKFSDVGVSSGNQAFISGRNRYQDVREMGQPDKERVLAGSTKNIKPDKDSTSKKNKITDLSKPKVSSQKSLSQKKINADIKSNSRNSLREIAQSQPFLQSIYSQLKLIYDRFILTKMEDRYFCYGIYVHKDTPESLIQKVASVQNDINKVFGVEKTEDRSPFQKFIVELFCVDETFGAKDVTRAAGFEVEMRMFTTKPYSYLTSGSLRVKIGNEEHVVRSQFSDDQLELKSGYVRTENEKFDLGFDNTYHYFKEGAEREGIKNEMIKLKSDENAEEKKRIEDELTKLKIDEKAEEEKGIKNELIKSKIDEIEAEIEKRIKNELIKLKFNEKEAEEISKNFRNYEFRTIGPLNKEEMKSGMKKLSEWLDPIVDDYEKNTVTNRIKNNKINNNNNMGDYIFKNTKTNNQFITSAKYKTDSIYWRPQITIGFDIKDLVQVMEDSNNLLRSINEKTIHIKLINFLNDPKQKQILKEEDLSFEPTKECANFVISGMNYLTNFNFEMPSGFIYLKDSPWSRIQFLLMMGAQWFKTIESPKYGRIAIKSDAPSQPKPKSDEEKEPKLIQDRCNKGKESGMLKDYTYFLPRIKESVLLDRNVILHILTEVSLFFDIHLPFEVCVNYEIWYSSIRGLKDRIEFYKNLIEEVKKRKSTNLKKLNVGKAEKFISEITKNLDLSFKEKKELQDKINILSKDIKDTEKKLESIKIALLTIKTEFPPIMKLDNSVKQEENNEKSKPSSESTSKENSKKKTIEEELTEILKELNELAQAKRKGIEKNNLNKESKEMSRIEAQISENDTLFKELVQLKTEKESERKEMYGIRNKDSNKFFCFNYPFSMYLTDILYNIKSNSDSLEIGKNYETFNSDGPVHLLPMTTIESTNNKNLIMEVRNFKVLKGKFENFFNDFVDKFFK